MHASPDEYVVVLTPGATAAAALVAASFPWTPESTFAHTLDNHTSILGVREAAAAAGAGVAPVVPTAGGGLARAGLEWRRTPRPRTVKGNVDTPCLLAWPLESNWGGARYSARLGEGFVGGAPRTPPPGRRRDPPTASDPTPFTAHAHETWFTLLDAARGAASAPPDLSTDPVDFCLLAPYKVWGAPSGLGALIVSRRGLAALHRGRRYWGGGAVDAVGAAVDVAALARGPAGLEDGTPPLAALLALPHAMEADAGAAGGARAAVAAGGARAARVAARCAAGLLALRREDGGPVVVVYGDYPGASTGESGERWRRGGPPAGAVGQGPTVAFSILRSGSTAVGWREVERLASLDRVLLRAGSLCNPGAAEAALGRGGGAAAAAAAAGAACADGSGLEPGTGAPTGVVRASFGRRSTEGDADAVVAFVARWFARGAAAAAARAPPSSAPVPLRIASLHVYPVKSAAGFSPPSWPLRPGGGGLACDRAWAAVDAGGRPLAARAVPALRAMRAVVELDGDGRATLTLHAPPGAAPPLKPLVLPPGDAAAAAAASPWLTAALGVPARLQEEPEGSRRGHANEADLLLVGAPSLAALATRLGADAAAADAARFRPNVVVAGPDLAPHAEDSWGRVRFAGGAAAATVVGPCARCPAVNAPADAAPPSRQPLLELARYRRSAGGRIEFGVLLAVDGGEAPAVLRVGGAVEADAA